MKNLRSFFDLTYLYVELTTRCALKCPRCPRTTQKNDYELKDLPLDLIEKRFFSSALQNLEFLELGGNYGDPIYHPQFVEILRALRRGLPRTRLILHTNGSHRKSEFWQDVAEILRSDDIVFLSIDGLRDTNGIYRQGSNWDSIVAAVDRLRGRARLYWKYIVFKHNEAQIEEATRVAASLGFNEIEFMKSSRFGAPYVLDGDDELEPSARWRTDRRQSGKAPAGFAPKCLTSSRHFISAAGLYSPCCWIAHARHIESLIPSAQVGDLSLYNHSFEEILNSEALKQGSEQIRSGQAPAFCRKTCQAVPHSARSKDRSMAVYLK